MIIKCDNGKFNVRNYVCVYQLPTVSSVCVTISGLCKLTVIADKRATVPSTVVTKECLSLNLVLYNPRTICFARSGI